MAGCWLRMAITRASAKSPGTVSARCPTQESLSLEFRSFRSCSLLAQFRNTPSGTVSTIAGVPLKEERSGNKLLTLVDGAANVATFGDPRGVAVDADGAIFVTDCYFHCIRKIAPASASAPSSALPAVTAAVAAAGGAKSAS